MNPRSIGTQACLTSLFVTFAASAFAKCPVPTNNGPVDVTVRAPRGILTIDTTGIDSVEVEGIGKPAEVQEKCDRNLIEITGSGQADWKIRVPKSVNLDLVSPAGTIQIGDSDGKVTLRTGGGSVTAGNIKGATAIRTNGGPIRTGNIGGSVELRSDGGDLQVGNVGGSADFDTRAGQIRVGIVQGRITAKTGGGNISIAELHGDVIAETVAGSITIGNARKMINANTGGGNIDVTFVKGGFKGGTAEGNVRIEQAKSWVEVSSGTGDIYVKVLPDNMEADFHVSLTTGTGNVTLYVPKNLKGVVEAIVDRQQFGQPSSILSDVAWSSTPPVRNSPGPRTSLTPPRNSVTVGGPLPAGAGNPIYLHSVQGKITLRQF